MSLVHSVSFLLILPKFKLSFIISFYINAVIPLEKVNLGERKSPPLRHASIGNARIWDFTPGNIWQASEMPGKFLKAPGRFLKDPGWFLEDAGPGQGFMNAQAKM